MNRLTGQQIADLEIKRLLSKKRRTIFEAAKLISLRENVHISCWEFEEFLKNRKKNE